MLFRSVVASAMCFALRLHTSAAPPRGGLTPALALKERTMQSNFTYTLDSLKRINGNGGGDQAVAETASNEMFRFIEKNSKVLDEYSKIVRLLDGNSANEIRSLMISMNHVMDALNEVSQFHRNSQLNDKFDVARHKADQIMESSSKKATALLSRLER